MLFKYIIMNLCRHITRFPDISLLYFSPLRQTSSQYCDCLTSFALGIDPNIIQLLMRLGNARIKIIEQFIQRKYASPVDLARNITSLQQDVEKRSLVSRIPSPSSLQVHTPSIMGTSCSRGINIEGDFPHISLLWVCCLATYELLKPLLNPHQQGLDALMGGMYPCFLANLPCILPSIRE